MSWTFLPLDTSDTMLLTRTNFLYIFISTYAKYYNYFINNAISAITPPLDKGYLIDR